ncbi:T200B protein, partial [Formicarius rufipectus]|nr:T200B protein [Formicarius rufipectus]
MTVESSEPNGPMRGSEPGVPKAPVPPVPPKRRGRRLRRKSPTETRPKGRLRMRSPAGAFVMVGISVVLVGMTIAVVGYWPHRGHGGTGSGAGNTSVAGDTRREVAATRPGPHSEKLKLIGPVIMGIGLFIFICANTMLYENRDMETRRLMQKGLYGMAGALPEGAGAEDGHCPKAGAECLEGCYRVDLSCQPCPGSKWSDCYSPGRLQAVAELLRHPAASPAGSLRSLRSVPGADTALGDPDVQLHAPGHSKSLDLGRQAVLLVAPMKDRKNRSWPRLDQVSLAGYAKLGSTGESSDRL